MIVTVTLNTSIDRTLFIKDFAWNRTIRASQSVLGMGGKAADASWVLGELGYENTAMGFAAGDTGRLMVKMLRQRGCKTDFVNVGGETRINIVVISEEGKGQSTLVSDGLEISAGHVQRFRKKFTAALKKAKCVLIGGSVPHGVDVSIYTSLVKEARAAGLPVVFDASGAGLKAGMDGRPTIAKPNMDEISDLAGQQVTSVEVAYRVGMELYRKYGAMLIITLGGEGALAILGDRAYTIPVLKIDVVSTAGAGDAVLAGLCAALSRSEPVEDGLRLGFAAAAAVCLTPATADCRRADVERFVPRIELIPYP
jgi:1-phosphofructokinase family hexose kinase